MNSFKHGQLEVVMAVLGVTLSIASGVSLALEPSGFDLRSWIASSAFCVFAIAIAASTLRKSSNVTEIDTISALNAQKQGRDDSIEDSEISAAYALIENDHAIELFADEVRCGLLEVRGETDGAICDIIRITASVEKVTKLATENAIASRNTKNLVVESGEHFCALGRALAQIKNLSDTKETLPRRRSDDEAANCKCGCCARYDVLENNFTARIEGIEIALKLAFEAATAIPMRMSGLSDHITALNSSQFQIAEEVMSQRVMINQSEEVARRVSEKINDFRNTCDRIVAMQRARDMSAGSLLSVIRAKPWKAAAILRLLVRVAEASSKKVWQHDAPRKWSRSR